MTEHETQLYHTLAQFDVPSHMRQGLVMYVTRGIRPGRLMEAFLKNDLYGVISRADAINRRRLYEIGVWIHSCAPVLSWGDAETVERWIERGGMAGRE